MYGHINSCSNVSVHIYIFSKISHHLSSLFVPIYYLTVDGKFHYQSCEKSDFNKYVPRESWKNPRRLNP